MNTPTPYEGDGSQPGDDALYQHATAQFHKAMLRKLRRHAVKGLWTTMTLPYLLRRIQMEVAELCAAVAAEVNAEDVEDECADIANLSMMLADNYRRGREVDDDRGD